MILVFLILFVSLLLVICTSCLKIEINKIYFYIGNEKIKNKNLLIENELFLSVYIFGKIRIWKYLINNRINESNINNKIKPKLYDKETAKEIINLLKSCKYNLNINTKVGTTSVITTSYVVSIISSVISSLGIIINNKKSSYRYKIKPIYDMKNFFKIELNGIICLKIVHIISIIKIINKRKRVNKYERTSYRRVNDYSYEQHTRYG